MKKAIFILIIFTSKQIVAQCDSSYNNIIFSSLKYFKDSLNKSDAKNILLLDSSAFTNERAMMTLNIIDKRLENIVNNQNDFNELMEGISKTYYLKKSFIELTKYSLVKIFYSQEKNKIFKEKNGWALFKNKFPNIKGFYTSTTPFINSTKDIASIVIEYSCGDLCGVCYQFVLLFNKNTKCWEVKYERPLFWR